MNCDFSPREQTPVWRWRKHVSRLAALALIGLAGCAHREAPKSPADTQPLQASEARSDFGMVSSGSEEATRAGVKVLEEGGNAVDAAVAAAFVLGVSDPGASGLGGMTYVLVSMADGRDIAIDGSTPAPFSINHQRLQSIKEQEEYFGYTTISVPTTLATLAHTLENYGTIDLAAVLAPAIEIAEQGFRLNPNSIAWAKGYLDEILAFPYLRHVVLEDGERLGQAGISTVVPNFVKPSRGSPTRASTPFTAATWPPRSLQISNAAAALCESSISPDTRSVSRSPFEPDTVTPRS